MSGWRALITGASSGIGEAIAREVARRGADVVLVARREQRLTALASALGQTYGSSAEVVIADLSVMADIDRVADRLRRGDIDLLVSDAATSGYVAVVDTDEAMLRDNWRLNTTAGLVLVGAVVPGLVERRRGGIILVSSNQAFSGGDGKPVQRSRHRSLYAASKAALVVFARTLAAEVAADGVAVTVVCPPRVSTEWNGGYTGDDVMDPSDVATAAVEALLSREVVCLPGLEDTSLWDDLVRAEAAVMQGNGGPGIALRYRTSSPP